MTKKVTELNKKIRVLTVQKYKDRKKLKIIAEHVKKIHKITSQLDRQPVEK